MSEVKRLDSGSSKQPITPPEQLALYDRYGSMAYGIILQIIPETNLAQEVLVNLFASSQLQACSGKVTNLATCIVRLARTLALEARAQVLSLDVDTPGPSTPTPEDRPKYIFDLAFRQGFALDMIAEKLKISKAEVMKSFHDYLKTLRQP